MRKVELNVNEQEKYDIIKNLVDNKGKVKRAAKRLGCSVANVYLLIRRYKSLGKEGFAHGNRNRKPSTTLSDDVIEQIIYLYREFYQDANFRHFAEFLASDHNLSVSYFTIHSILSKANFLSPKCRRITRKKWKAAQKSQAIPSGDDVILPSSSHLMDPEDAHPRKPRKALFGELLQMDASQHRWFGSDKSFLHIAIDDATGRILGAHFDHQETLSAYYHVFHQVLTRHGIPYEFLTDNRTIFNFKKEKNPSLENDTFTQFGFACKQLGTVLSTTSVPQGKGRVERAFGTLQGRLPVELRRAGIDSVGRANEFLVSYINEFNRRFSLPFHDTNSVFEKQEDLFVLNYALSVVAPRVTDNGSSIRYKNKIYRFKDASGQDIFPLPKTACYVLDTFDGRLLAWIREEVYSLEEVPSHRHDDFHQWIVTDRKPKSKAHTPPMSHPWKAPSFESYMKRLKKEVRNNANV